MDTRNATQTPLLRSKTRDKSCVSGSATDARGARNVASSVLTPHFG